MDLTRDEPDVKQIVRAQTTLRPSPVRANDSDSDFAVVVSQATWNAILEHARSRRDVEVGGVLLGTLCRDTRETPYLHLEGFVAALAAESRAANVTFTAESWTRIHDTIDRTSPGATIVGWYHTHPSFGIFLSEMDVFIQRHFFEAPHQVAIVIDPIANTHGCFVWQNGVPTEHTMLFEEMAGSDPASPVDFRKAFKQREEHRQRSLFSRMDQWVASRGFAFKAMLILLAFVIVFGICCLLLWTFTPLLAHWLPEKAESSIGNIEGWT